MTVRREMAGGEMRKLAEAACKNGVGTRSWQREFVPASQSETSAGNLGERGVLMADSRRPVVRGCAEHG